MLVIRLLTLMESVTVINPLFTPAIPPRPRLLTLALTDITSHMATPPPRLQATEILPLRAGRVKSPKARQAAGPYPLLPFRTAAAAGGNSPATNNDDAAGRAPSIAPHRDSSYPAPDRGSVVAQPRLRFTSDNEGEPELESDSGSDASSTHVHGRPSNTPAGAGPQRKPRGDAGRPKRGGYTLRRVMRIYAGVSKEKYVDMKVILACLAIV